MHSFLQKFRTPVFFATVAGILIQGAVFSSASADESNAVRIEKKSFIVTAYYSPLPNQSRYLRGSYEGDIRLNGNGTNGASGKPVYPGMLAAPKSYSFGTVIHLEGLGTGTVDDRGGAIVKAGERGQEWDRIDVWMGSGEEGLARALSWGRRTVRGTVHHGLTPNREITSLQITKIPKVSLASLEPKPATERVFSEPIGPNSSPILIKTLSERLISVWYLSGKPRELFDPEMRFALIRLQTDHALVKNPADSNAGYYGPSTRKVLKKAYETYLADKARADSEIAAVLSEILAKAKAEAAEAQKIRLSLEGVGIPKAGETGAHVRSLQEALSKLGYFDRKTTGIFGAKTREAVARFQIDSGLVSGMNDPNAGKFGNRTKTKLLLSLAEKGTAPKK